jgi:DNA-binding CsgD family transcriptional regulator
VRATIAADTTIATGRTVTIGQQAGAVAAGTADTAVATDADRQLTVGTGAPCVAPHPGHELLTCGTAETDNGADLPAGATIATVAATELAITTEATGATIAGQTCIAPDAAATSSAEVSTDTTDATTTAAATVTTETTGTTIAAQVVQAHAAGAAFAADTTGAADTAGATQTTDTEHESGSTTGTTVAAQATDESVTAGGAVQCAQHALKTRLARRADRAGTTSTTGAAETEEAHHVAAGAAVAPGHERIDGRATRAAGTAVTEQPAADTAGAAIATLDTDPADTTIAEHARGATNTTGTISDAGHALGAGTAVAEQEPTVAEVAEPPERAKQGLVGPGEPINTVADQLPTEQVHPRLVDQVQKQLVVVNEVLRQVVQRQVQLLVVEVRHRHVELLEQVVDEPGIRGARVGEPSRPHVGRRLRIRQSRPEHRVEQILDIRRGRRHWADPECQEGRHSTRRAHHTPPRQAPISRTKNFARYPPAHGAHLSHFPLSINAGSNYGRLFTYRQLGPSPSDFDRRWAQGHALSTDEAIAYACRIDARGRRPSSGWASLTPAELNVARLISSGLRDKDIAAQLSVSPRTVHSHLNRIYTKLDISSRLQLAQEAARHP